jgi:hypothetical protein
MPMKPLIPGRVLATFALSASLFAAALGAQTTPSLTLFNAEGLQGAAVVLRGDVANLQDVPAAEGFDGTANDYAFSLKADGLWLVCMDAGFTTRCRELSGEVANLGEDGGSISSVRYLGPAMASGVAAPRVRTPAPGAADPAAGDEAPMFNIDLYGSDLRGIIYDRPGMDWKSCKASCDDDRQCRAWTYVVPGRTEHGECFLKEAVPEPSESECCISGIKRKPMRTGHVVPPAKPGTARRSPSPRRG